MQIPANVTSRELATMASPNETHLVRVILTRVNNSSAARLKCGARTYIFERNGQVGAHTLDIPASLYMQGVPDGQFRANQSIAHDLKPTADNGLVIYLVPLAAPQSIEKPDLESQDAKLVLIGELLEVIGAPEIMLEAIQLARNGTTQELESFVKSIALIPDEPEEIAQKEPQDEAGASVATGIRPLPSFAIIGKEIFKDGVKVAIFVEPDKSLRMAQGKSEFRDEVEAFLASQPAPEDESPI